MAWRSFGRGVYVTPHRYLWRVLCADITDNLILSQAQKRGGLEAALTLDIATE